MVKLKIANETKHDKFKRIASTRANRILNDLRLLSNCSNKSDYDYSQEDVRKIFNAIDSELKRTKMMFESKKKKRTFGKPWGNNEQYEKVRW